MKQTIIGLILLGLMIIGLSQLKCDPINRSNTDPISMEHLGLDPLRVENFVNSFKEAK